jgi:hypothetical protein
MPRKPRTDTPAAAPTAAPPALLVIHPDSVLSVEQAQHLLGLKRSTVRREVRESRLKISKRAGKHFLLGSQLLDWLRAGELPRRGGRPASNGDAGGPHDAANG